MDYLGPQRREGDNVEDVERALSEVCRRLERLMTFQMAVIAYRYGGDALNDIAALAEKGLEVGTERRGETDTP